MTLEDKVHAFRLRVLQRAQELGNVSAACREAGISRTLFYRWKKRFSLYGIDGLHPRRTATHPGRPVQLDRLKERRIVAMALFGWSPPAPQTDATRPNDARTAITIFQNQLEPLYKSEIRQVPHWHPPSTRFLGGRPSLSTCQKERLSRSSTGHARWPTSADPRACASCHCSC